MPTTRVPLVGSPTNRKTDVVFSDVRDQFFRNCFPEITVNPGTGRTVVVLTKRQGTNASAAVSAGAAIGCAGAVVWSSNVSAGAVDAPVVLSFRKDPSTAMQFFNAETLAQVGGDVATTGTANCLFMSEADVGGTGNLSAAVIDGSTVEMWFFPSGGAWTQITDSDFPSAVTPSHAHLDGYMFVMTEGGRIYNSDLNSLSAWTSTSFITASSFGDKGVGCVRYRNYILGLGDYSIEFFVNAGNPSGSVLKRLPDATVDIGALRNGTTLAPAMRTIGDSLYWIGQRAGSGARGIFRLTGLRAEKISTTAIDKLVSNGVIRSVKGSFPLLGMTHVMFSTTSNSFSWCYCPETNVWWQFANGTNSSFAAAIGAVDSSYRSKVYFTSPLNAKVYSMNPGASVVWADDANSYSLIVQTQNMDMGTRRRKFWSALSLLGDRQTSESTITVKWNDDDEDFTNGPTDGNRTLDLAAATANRITRLGSSRRRSWHLEHSAATPCRLEALEIEYEVGSH